MQITDRLFKIIIIVLCWTFFVGCASSIIAPSRYVYSSKPPTNRRSTVGFAYAIDISPDSTYKYVYRNAANYRYHSYGIWSITPRGRLLLQDTLSTVTQIPIKVSESSDVESVTTVFDFQMDMEPAFWSLVINNVMYPIVEKRVAISGEIDFDYFYLLGFNKKYEGLNSPNEIVKTKLYYIIDKKNHLFSIELPDYAVNYEILFYKPMYERFIIKKQKLIQESNNVEYRIFP